MTHTSTRGTLASLAVVAMVSLSGCVVAGVPVGAPAPYTDSGAALDGGALAADHTTGLSEAGAYRTTTNLTLEHGDGAVTVDRQTAVDDEANRSRSSRHLNSRAIEGEGLHITTYTENDTSARRVTLGVGDTEATHYDAARAPYDDGLLAVSPVEDDTAMQGDLVAAAADEVDWAQRGVERHDGVWVTRYEANGTDEVSDLGLLVDAALTDAAEERTDLQPEDVDATGANATMLVTADGVVRHLSLTVVGTTDDGETVELTVTLAVDDVGSTDVQRPAWYGEATDDLDG